MIITRIQNARTALPLRIFAALVCASGWFAYSQQHLGAVNRSRFRKREEVKIETQWFSQAGLGRAQFIKFGLLQDFEKQG